MTIHRQPKRFASPGKVCARSQFLPLLARSGTFDFRGMGWESMARLLRLREIMKQTSFFSLALFAAALMAAPVACGGYEGDEQAEAETTTETEDGLFRGTFVAADGDPCIHSKDGTGVPIPGEEKNGECCKL